MKFIIRHFTLLSVFCFTLGCYAQSRAQNISSSVKIIGKSEKLSQAIGWKQDLTGEWISNTNVISDTKLTSNEFSTVPQNFKWIQFVLLTLSDTTYYCMLYENEVYLSNSLNERRINFYIMNTSSYTDLFNNLTHRGGKTLTLHSSIFGYLSNRDVALSQEKLLELIEQKISSQDKLQYDLFISRQHIDDTDVVRFRLPEQSSIMGGILNQGYFEISADIFSQLLLPPLPSSPIQAGVNEEFELDAESLPAITLALQKENSNTGNISGEFLVNKTPSGYVDESSVGTIQDKHDVVEGRQNKETPIVSSPIAKMTNIKGWYYNSEGKWVSDIDYSYGFETVGKYEFRNMSYKGRDYLVLIKYEKYTGALYFVVPKDDYVIAVRAMNNSGTVQFPIIAHVGLGYTIDDLVKATQVAIDAPQKEQIVKKEFNLVMQYRTSPVKDVARFFIYAQSCTQYGESGNKSCDTKVSNKIKYTDTSLIGTQRLFEKMYYETSFKNFDAFLKFPLSDNKQIEMPVVKEKVGDGLESRN